MELEAFELVILRRPPDAASYDEETLERIQREHLAYQESLRAAGRIVTNGPVLDQPDPSLRGITFYRTGSLEEARRLAEQDPAVRAGRLAVDVMTWLCPPGTMVRPGRPVSEPS
ncbi:MAG: YciI family protein [Actinomycetota bacterium]|nr:YciI family protein [Actinomycetota bacterium]